LQEEATLMGCPTENLINLKVYTPKNNPQRRIYGNRPGLRDEGGREKNDAQKPVQGGYLLFLFKYLQGQLRQRAREVSKTEKVIFHASFSKNSRNFRKLLLYNLLKTGWNYV